ncbi:MAG: tetratricopeptide repeat protein, partial [Terriglobales bacterium]
RGAGSESKNTIVEAEPVFGNKRKGKSGEKQLVQTIVQDAKPADRRYQWASVRPLLIEKIPFFALAALSCIVTYAAQKNGGSVVSFETIQPAARIANASVSYIIYIGKTIWPNDLAVYYPYPGSWPLRQVLGAALLLIAVTFAAIWQAERLPYLAFGWLWFAGTLVPVIGIVQVGAQAMADRYAYIPFLGLFLMFTWLVADGAAGKTQIIRRVSAAWLAVPALAVLLLLGALTHRQIRYWHDPPSLWTRALSLTDNNYIAHDMLAEYLSNEGQTEGAAAQFRAALAINPNYLPANLGLGTYEHAHGNLPAAIERYRIVALHAAQPGVRAAAYGNLGSAYRQLGDFVTAKQCFETSLKFAPDRPMAMIGLGLIAQSNGDFDEALRQYSRAMAIQPTDIGYLLIAGALEQQGHSDQASAIRERVARYSPDFPAAQKEAQSLLGR